MTRLEKLITLLTEGLPEPTSTNIGLQEDTSDNDDVCDMQWFCGRSYVSLQACTHHIRLIATMDDGGPCPPHREFSYSPIRLKKLLDWLASGKHIKAVDDLHNDGSFHQKYADDPPITKYMFSGDIRTDTWSLLDRLTISK
jgi:hypothetical protein